MTRGGRTARHRVPAILAIGIGAVIATMTGANAAGADIGKTVSTFLDNLGGINLLARDAGRIGENPAAGHRLSLNDRSDATGEDADSCYRPPPHMPPT